MKVVAGDREYLYSLTLPELWDSKWDAARRRAHRHSALQRGFLESSRDLWPWLALAGALGLLAEWLLYGRFRRGMLPRRTLAMREAPEKVEAGR